MGPAVAQQFAAVGNYQPVARARVTEGQPSAVGPNRTGADNAHSIIGATGLGRATNNCIGTDHPPAVADHQTVAPAPNTDAQVIAGVVPDRARTGDESAVIAAGAHATQVTVANVAEHLAAIADHQAVACAEVTDIEI